MKKTNKFKNHLKRACNRLNVKQRKAMAIVMLLILAALTVLSICWEQPRFESSPVPPYGEMSLPGFSNDTLSLKNEAL